MDKTAYLTGDTMHKGNSSEAIVLAAYARAGFIVSLPFGSGAAYDLIVDTGAQFIRIQVKTGWRHNGCLLYKGRRRIKDSSQNGMRRYRVNEVDYFAVYDPDADNIYVVPLTDMGVDGCLRLAPVLNGQKKHIRWAQDYTWEKHVDILKAELTRSYSKQVL